MSRGLDREALDLALDAVGAFAREHLPDAKRLELDHADEFPVDIVRAMCGGDLGIQLLFVPEEYGGMGGGAFDVYRVCEQLARIDLGVATGVLATFLGSDPIRAGGTEEQRRRWLGAIAEQGLLMAYAATEPEAGSDLGALRTTARPIEEGGEIVAYRLDGAKQWISNGGYADLYSVLALAPGGPTWFVVDAGTPGLSHGLPEDKHGIRASNTAEVHLDGVRVERDRLIGGVEGQGLIQAQMVFGFTRLMVAAFGLGAGWAALDRAIPYSVERIQAGGPLSEKQGYTHKLITPHVVALEAARAFIEETAERIDADDGQRITEGAIAKYLASEAGNRAAEAAIQALGGYGYTREYMVEKIKRDVRITTIYEGTSEILEMTTARDRWQLHLKSRGEHYHEEARALEALEREHPGCGAREAALALHALAVVAERARLARLTRHQHLLFRLGEWIALAESAASAARRAARAADGALDAKADRRFPATTLAEIARVWARDAALAVATGGVRWAVGATAAANAATDAQTLAAEVRLAEILAAQSGLIEDLDRITDRIYGRTTPAGAA